MLVNENDKILKQVAPEFDFENLPEGFDDEKLRQFVDTLFTTMRLCKGIGLASSQVGKSMRLFIMEAERGQQLTCFNPKIIENNNETCVGSEGCLSFLGLSLKIKRFESVYVTYQNIDGKSVSQWLYGLSSRCFQHELNHLDGITFDTLASKVGLRLAKDKQRKLLRKLEKGRKI